MVDEPGGIGAGEAHAVEAAAQVRDTGGPGGDDAPSAAFNEDHFSSQPGQSAGGSRRPQL